MMIKDMDKCPYCGSEEYYIKQSYKGICNYNMRFDGRDTENGEMHQGASYKTKSKFAWCKECHKKLFELDKDWLL